MSEPEVLDAVFGSDDIMVYEEVEFLQYLITYLTGVPNGFTIDRTMDERGVLLTLTIDQEYAGRVIGRRGITASAIRCLLHALGAKNHANYNLYIGVSGE